MSYYSKPELKIIHEEADYVLVKVPFALKDDFKTAFSHARWKREATAWKVPADETAKLSAWISGHEQAYADLLEEYEELKSAHEAAEAERQAAEQRARLMREIEIKKQQALIADGEAEFAKYSSVLAAREAFRKVCNGAGVPKAWARTERNEGKQMLIEIQEALMACNLQSVGIREIRSYNMNRITRREAEAAFAKLFLLEPYSSIAED